MSKSITNNQQSLLRGVTAGLFALMLAVFAMPAQAQMDDGELPKIDFSVNLMQSAQYIAVDRTGNQPDDPIMGFHTVRAGLNSSVQFSENVSGLLMIEQEPNDFGNSNFSPAVDFAILNLQVTDQLTVQAGTPVTGLLNFRGFSDGPVVQGNPLIGNSPADMITAGQGVKLIGSYPSFGFDLTLNRSFTGDADLTTVDATADGTTGLNIIGKARYTGAEIFKVGGGIAFATGQDNLVFANGDRENYNISQLSNGGINTKNTHAAIPGGGWIGQVDAKIAPGNGLSADLWAGYASDSDAGANDPAAAFGGVGAKFDINDDFYVAGRFTIVSDQSDLDDTDALTRIQGGIGYMVFDKALLKVEGFTQSVGDGSAGPALGTTETDPQLDSFSGVLTELSFNF
jgi:hypothetical protein